MEPPIVTEDPILESWLDADQGDLLQVCEDDELPEFADPVIAGGENTGLTG
jgi:hypothetical protein